MSNLKDYATSTVAVAPSPASSGTTLEVETGHGARFPSAPFFLTAHPPFEFPTLDNAEKLLVTAVDGDEFTIDREEGDTSAQAIEAGWRVSNSLFLGDIPADFDDLADGATNVAFTTTLKSKLDNIEALADVTDATNVNAAGATMNSDTTLAGNGYFLDEDTLSSNSDTKVPSQQSVKAYVDAAIVAAKAALYPVGSIYINRTSSTNPGTLLGFGTWTQVTDKMIMARGSTYTADGGAATHTHALTAARAALEVTGTTLLFDRDTTIPFTATVKFAASGGSTENNAASRSTKLLGSTDSGSTIPPMIVAYVWERTA